MYYITVSYALSWYIYWFICREEGAGKGLVSPTPLKEEGEKEEEEGEEGIVVEPPADGGLDADNHPMAASVPDPSEEIQVI